MALAGITCVGEFHYLHHGPTASPYAARTRWARRWSPPRARPASGSPCSTRATSTAGSCRRLLGPVEVQRRFSDGDADALGRAGRRAATVRHRTRIGAAIHSVRAVDPAVDGARRAWARRRRRCTPTCPSSRPRTSSASRITASRPLELLAEAGALRTGSPPCTPRTSPTSDVALLGAARLDRVPSARPPSATSPTASARPAGCAARDRRLRSAVGLARGDRPVRGGPAVELDERLAQPSAGTTDSPSCSPRDRSTGTRCLGWPDAGRSPSGACRPRDRAPRHRAHRRGAARRGARRRVSPRPPADVTDVVVGGRLVVVDGAHARSTSRPSSRRRSLRCWTDEREHATIRRAVAGHRRHRAAGHQRSRARRRAARVVRNACVVVVDDIVVVVGPARERRPTSASTPRGRCVLPGFVDSHTHLVFAGDRGDEFAARMAGRAVRRRAASASRPTPRGRERRRARRLAAPAARRGAPRRHHHRRDQVRLRAQRRATRPARCCDRPRGHRRHDVPRRPRVPPEFEGRADDYVHLVCTDMLDARRAACTLDRRVLRGGRVRRRPVPGGARRGPRRRARAAAARQPARSRARRAARGRVRLRVGRPLHLPDRRRHRRAGRRATPSPRSCRPPTSRPASPTPTPAA